MGLPAMVIGVGLSIISLVAPSLAGVVLEVRAGAPAELPRTVIPRLLSQLTVRLLSILPRSAFLV